MAEVKGHSIPTDSKFYDNLATDFGLGSRENALAFWTKFRHGLAHQAAVRGFEDNLRWETILGPHPDGVPPVLVDTVNGIQMFFVDPIKLRDDLLPMMENDKEMWTGETAYPLMEVWQL